MSMDGESPKTNICIFNASEDMDTMRNYEQVNMHIPFNILATVILRELGIRALLAFIGTTV